jgi:hypothetical protein
LQPLHCAAQNAPRQPAFVETYPAYVMLLASCQQGPTSFDSIKTACCTAGYWLIEQPHAVAAAAQVGATQVTPDSTTSLSASEWHKLQAMRCDKLFQHV